MKKAIVVLILALCLGSIPAMAQTTPLLGYWKTEAACMAAKNSPYYYPTVLSKKKMVPGEAIYGNPTGGCADMDLPDRLGGRGWVRIGPDRKLVYDLTTGKILRLEECDNKIYAWAPFPEPQGAPGRQGIAGQNGKDGENGRDGADGNDGKGASIGKVVAIAGATAVGLAALVYAAHELLDNNDKKDVKGPGAIIGPAFLKAVLQAIKQR